MNPMWPCICLLKILILVCALYTKPIRAQPLCDRAQRADHGKHFLFKNEQCLAVPLAEARKNIFSCGMNPLISL